MESYNHSVGNALVDVVTVTKSAQTNPDYKTRIAKGIPLKDLPYSLSIKYSEAAMQGLHIVDWKGKTSEIAPTPALITDNSTPFQRIQDKLDSRMSALMDYKSNRLLSKVKAQSLPILMLYKERHETGALITSFLQKSIEFAKSVKKRDFRQAISHFGTAVPDKKVRRFERWCKLMYPLRYTGKVNNARSLDRKARSIGAAWLQARFAWLPLYKDIEDSLEAAATQEKKLHTFSQRVGSKFGFDVTYCDKVIGYTCDSRNVHTGSRKGHFGMIVHYQISDSTLSTVSSIMDPLTVAWDAVPWSFLIDRVVDISNYLDVQSATVGTSFTTGSSSLYYEDTYHSPSAGAVLYYYPNIIGCMLENGRTYYLTGETASRTDVRMKRTVLTEYPKPKLLYPMRDSIRGRVDIGFLALQLRKKLSDRRVRS